MLRFAVQRCAAVHLVHCYTGVSYMHEWMTGFLQWSINKSSLTGPGVHCCWCALVAAFYGRDADAILGAWKQVWCTNTRRDAVTNLPHNIARVVWHSAPHSTCMSIRWSFSHNSPISSTSVMRSWQIYMYITMICEEIHFFHPLHNWSVPNQSCTSTMSFANYRNWDEEMRNGKWVRVTEIIRRECGAERKWEWQRWNWLHWLQRLNRKTRGPFTSILMPAVPFAALWPFRKKTKTKTHSSWPPPFWQPFNIPAG